MLRFVTIISTLAIICGSVALSSAEGDEEWRQYHEQVFKVKGASIGVEKTIELLHKLDELYVDKFPYDYEAQARVSQLNSLLDLLQVNEEKCNDQYTHNVKNLLWVNILRTNAYAYIEHQRDLQYDLCQKLSISSLEESVQNMKPEDRTEFEALVKSVDQGAESIYFEDAAEDTYIAGMLSYVEAKKGNILEKVDHDSVATLIGQTVEDLCLRSVREVREPLIMYNLFHEETNEFVDPWNHRRDVCMNLLTHIKNVKEAAYKALKSAKNKDSLGSKIKQKLRSPFAPKSPE